MRIVYDSMSEVIHECPTIQSAKELVGRLEAEDKYIGLFVPNRYKISRSRNNGKSSVMRNRKS
jgi:hypothetical protein